VPGARGEGQTGSAVGIGFDKAVIGSGHEIPLRNVDISAVAEAEEIARRRRQRDDDGIGRWRGGWTRGGREPDAGKPKGPRESSTFKR